MGNIGSVANGVWQNPHSRNHGLAMWCGRERLNAAKRLKRDLRRQRILQELMLEPWRWIDPPHGAQLQLSRKLGIPPWTICKDLKALRACLVPCPTCGGIQRPKL